MENVHSDHMYEGQPGLDQEYRRSLNLCIDSCEEPGIDAQKAQI